MKVALICLFALIALTSAQTGCWLRSHGRGVGKVITSCREGEEKNGALCYPLCKDGYHGVGPVCWKFPKSYGRGAGKPLTCAANLEMSGALCYPKCGDGYHGVGPVCWGSCPAGYNSCGALCIQGQSCSGKIADLAKQALTGIEKAAGDIGSPVELTKDVIQSMAGLALNLVYPLC